ncbi:MAG: glycosyltransferase family 1 protein [Bacillota bacterium]|nr:glycosyltransferase family 1 protein [Bacillota bacterium]
MIRVLHIVPIMNRAGQETFIMNVYRSLDRSRVQFDFLALSDEEGDYDEEIRSLGGRVFHARGKHLGIRESRRQIAAVVEQGGFRIVHRHYQNATMLHELLAARAGGADCLIAHSHNTASERTWLHRLLRPLLYRVADWHLACSEAAGQWMFGNRPFDVVANGIDPLLFQYNPELRRLKRQELAVDDSLVVGHIGRMNEVKNQSWLLRVLQELLERRPDAVLLLIGGGEDETKLREQTAALGLQNAVRFLGVRADIAGLLQAMDVFALPSLYEGLPVTLVEAQAAGLPCVVSDRVTREVALVPEVSFLSLDESPRSWASLLISEAARGRRDTREEIRAAGFDIHDVADRLVAVYESLPPAASSSRRTSR